MKAKTYFWLAIVFFIMACINLVNSNPFDEVSTVGKFMKVGWFILAGVYFLNYRKLKKEEDEKSAG